MEGNELALKIAAILDNKKAQNIVIVDVAPLTVIADKFVICSATSTIQARALCDEVKEVLDKKGIHLIRNDGYRESRWVVLDYGQVIAHIFHVQERDFYNIERLWADGDNIRKYASQ